MLYKSSYRSRKSPKFDNGIQKTAYRKSLLPLFFRKKQKKVLFSCSLFHKNNKISKNYCILTETVI